MCPTRKQGNKDKNKQNKTQEAMKTKWTSEESVAALKQMLAARLAWEEQMRSRVAKLNLSKQGQPA